MGDLTFNVLHPVEPLVDDTNNNSIVLMLSYGEIDFLFTRDAEHEAEASILVQSIVPLAEVEILKVGHHGSRTASSQSFLDIIHPAVAIYMAAVGNRYGHPHEETISALQAIGVEIYGTDTHGTIVVETDGETSAITFTLTSAQVSTAELSRTYSLPKGLVNSDLEIYVDGTLWKRVENLSDFGPNDQVYVVVEDSEDQSNIRFGDGKNGARLPSGSSNVVATYPLGRVADGDVLSAPPTSTPTPAATVTPSPADLPPTNLTLNSNSVIALCKGTKQCFDWSLLIEDD